MTKAGYTALVFVVDASGSMWAIHHDMEGAIEALLAQQKNLPGKLTVDLVYFDAPHRRPGIVWAGGQALRAGHFDDDWYQEAYHLADPENVKVHIQPRGGTALYDALGRKITSFGKALAEMPEDERPENVLFAAVTDGEENSSVEYTAVSVKALIQEQTDKYSWNFTYLGANQDAVLTAQTMGISSESALTWNTKNVAAATTSLNSYTTSLRSAGVASYSTQDRDSNA